MGRTMDAFSQSINGPDARTDKREQCWFPPLILGERGSEVLVQQGTRPVLVGLVERAKGRSLSTFNLSEGIEGRPR